VREDRRFADLFEASPGVDLEEGTRGIRRRLLLVAVCGFQTFPNDASIASFCPWSRWGTSFSGSGASGLI